MTPTGGIKPHRRFSITTKRSEVLFLDYMIEHLTPAGKAGVVVPEGIHFVAQAGYVQLRRTLLEKGFLLADISLPHGVFKPYASVKTHVLVMDRSLARHCDSVLFVEIENDGFSQSDTREPVAGSQIEAAKHCVLSLKRAAEGRPWERGTVDVRAYEVSKSALLKYARRPTSWDAGTILLPTRVIHRRDVPLKRLGDLCG